MRKPCHLANLCLLLIVSYFACAYQVKASERSATLLFSGALPDINASYGAYAELGHISETLYKQNKPVFFLFGGWSIGPSRLAYFDRGVHIIDLLNLLKTDVMAVSKRETIFGLSELQFRAYEAEFPFVSSNLLDAATQSHFERISPYVVVEKQGVRVGVVSTIDPSVFNDYLSGDIALRPIESALDKALALMELAAIDIKVLIYSDFHPYVEKLLSSGAIDIALSTVSHNLIEQRQGKLHQNNYALTQYGQAIQLDITLFDESSKTKQITARHIELTGLPKSENIVNRVEYYTNRLDNILSNVVTKTSVKLDMSMEVVRGEEAVIGNLLTDVLKASVNADIAVLNGGFIRGENVIDAGEPILLGDLLEVLPFRNDVSLVSVTGRQVAEMIQHGLDADNKKDGSFLQVSGVEIHYSDLPTGKRKLKAVWVNGELLEENKRYRLVTTDFLVNGGDGYKMLVGSPSLFPELLHPPTIFTIISEELSKMELIQPKLENRIVKVPHE